MSQRLLDQVGIIGFRVATYTKKTFIILILGILILGIFSPIQAVHHRRQILILNSYHIGYPWSDEEMAGIQSTLHPDDVLQIEFMDTKRIETENYLTALANLYRLKYKDESFDLIYVLDDKAYQFMLTYHDEIFPDAPVVFLGVDNYQESDLDGIDWLTGTVEISDYQGQIDVIHEVLPDTTTVYLITDSTYTGFVYRQQVKTLEDKGLLPVEINYIGDFETGTEWTSLLETISSMPADSAVLFTSYTRDRNGEAFDTNEAFLKIIETANGPVFVDYIGHLNLGGVGGKLKDPYQEGECAGEIGASILEGTAPNEIPVKQEGNTIYQFNHQALKEWQIPHSRLPAGSTILNKPEKNMIITRQTLLVGTLLLLAETGLILLLFRINHERRQAEKALRDHQMSLEGLVEERTQELKDAVVVKDQFLANMSHELRTPLTAIIGFSELLLMQTDAVLPEKQKNSLKYIFKSGEHLLDLINDVLTMTKIYSQKIELEPAQVKVRDLVNDAVMMAKIKADHKGIPITVQHEPFINTIWADERRLRQLLIILLDNAIKFSPEGSKIEVEVKLEVSETSELNISVKDHGIGIPKEDQQRIFEPFVQLDNELSRAYEGSGLGLAVGKQLVEMHEGAIEVISAPNKGTTMIIKIPVREQTQNVRSTDSHLTIIADDYPSLRGKGIRILLVEDNYSTIDLLSHIFNNLEITLDVARDGRTGFELAREDMPDLIIMDLHLPKMDGFEAIRKIRAMKHKKQPPILAISAVFFEEDSEKAQKAGANAFLKKPFMLRELFQQLVTLLELE